MNDEHPHIVAECAKCHFRFDILFGVDCPRCRTEAVREAFAPLDPLRTALGMGYAEAVRDLEKVDVTPKDMPEGIRWHGPYYRPTDVMEDTVIKLNVIDRAQSPRLYYSGGSPVLINRAVETEVPEGCKIPKGEAAQRYELCRLFRKQ